MPLWVTIWIIRPVRPMYYWWILVFRCSVNFNTLGWIFHVMLIQRRNRRGNNRADSWFLACTRPCPILSIHYLLDHIRGHGPSTFRQKLRLKYSPTTLFSPFTGSHWAVHVPAGVAANQALMVSEVRESLRTIVVVTGTWVQAQRGPWTKYSWCECIRQSCPQSSTA